MDVQGRRRRTFPHEGPILTLCLLLASARAVCADTAGPGQESKLDCGVNALFILLRLEGRPITLDRLYTVLPPRHGDGYSMAELAAAARSLGLRLGGVRFFRGDQALDRPAIAFIKDARGGHFMVLRPVGTTGTMVQVINPPHVPFITDYDRLFTARSWTGRILLPRDPWHVRCAIPLVLAGLCATVISLVVWQHKRSLRPRTPEIPAAA